MLRSQTERLKVLLAERQALKSPDPEIIRLSNLADEAISEGALSTALRLHELAKARVRELKPTLARFSHRFNLPAGRGSHFGAARP
jgi:hypothetical protein